jgi:hypothetical protein
MQVSGSSGASRHTRPVNLTSSAEGQRPDRLGEAGAEGREGLRRAG